MWKEAHSAVARFHHSHNIVLKNEQWLMGLSVQDFSMDLCCVLLYKGTAVHCVQEIIVSDLFGIGWQRWLRGKPAHLKQGKCDSSNPDVLWLYVQAACSQHIVQCNRITCYRHGYQYLVFWKKQMQENNFMFC